MAQPTCCTEATHRPIKSYKVFAWWGFAASFFYACGNPQSPQTLEPQLSPEEYKVPPQELTNCSILTTKIYLKEKNKAQAIVCLPPNQDFYALPLQTIPGVHWAWNQRFAISSLAEWKNSAWYSPNVQSLEPKMSAIQQSRTYAYTLSTLPDSSYPVVSGGISTAQQTGSLMPYNLMLFLPQNVNQAVQLEFYGTEGQPLKIYTNQGIRLQNHTIHFNHLTELVDTPLYISPHETLTETNSRSEQVFFTTFNNTYSDIKTLLPWIDKAYNKLALLQTYWPNIAPKNLSQTYQVHVLIGAHPTSIQGLEHYASTVVHIPDGFSSNQEILYSFYRTLVHEMIHVWNAKYLYPISTATWNPWRFNADRCDYLWFYEGFTEAYTRLSIYNDFSSNSLRNLWAQTTLRVQSLPKNLTLNELSRTSPFSAYEAGAMLGLWLASLLRQVYGINKAQEKIYNLLPQIIEQYQKKSLLKPWTFSEPWKQCPQGGIQCVLNNGYTLEHLIDAIFALFPEPIPSGVYDYVESLKQPITPTTWQKAIENIEKITQVLWKNSRWEDAKSEKENPQQTWPL